MTIEDVDHPRLARLFAAQRANRLALKREGPAARIRRLQRLRAEIVRRAADADEALHADLGRPREGAANAEVASVIADIDTAVAELEGWMAPEAIEPSPHFRGAETYILYEPRGVVLLFGPWNFPFALVFAPLVPILAAGNACFVKPNELQPRVSRLTHEIIGAVFAETEVVCLEGGVPLARALQELPFDHVFFTGSPAVGRQVMAAAARHLSSVTLELGGKCPAILDGDCDLDDAAAKIVSARFYNGGQLCLAVDHVWAPRARAAELVDRLGAAIRAAFYESDVYAPGRMSRLLDARAFARVQGYLDEAVARGARIVHGGGADVAGLSLEPTVVLDAPNDCALMREEIFGPVLPVAVYDDISEVAEQVERTGKPLAVYIFSRDPAFVADVLDRTSSGGVTINHVLMHAVESRLPFGGVNSSGMGRYKGVHGFRELSNARSVFAQPV